MSMYKNINKEIIEENVKLRQQIDCLRREIVMERQRSVEKNEELVFMKIAYKEKTIELLKFVAPDLSINFGNNYTETSQTNNISRGSDESQRFSNNNRKQRSSSQIVEQLRHSSSVMRNSNPVLMSPTRCSSPTIESSPNSAVPSSINDDDDYDPEESILEHESKRIMEDSSSMDISAESESKQNELPKDQIENNNELYSINEDSENNLESLSELESNCTDSIIECESSSATLTNEVSQHKQNDGLLFPPPLARTPKSSSPLRNVTNNRTTTMQSCKVTLQRKRPPPLPSKEEQQKIKNGNTIPDIQIERHAIEYCDMSFSDSPFLPTAESTPQFHHISMAKKHNANETQADANAIDNRLIEFDKLIISNFDLDNIESQEKQSTEKKTKKKYKTETENRANMRSNTTQALKKEMGSSDDESSNCTRNSRPLRACRPTTLTEPSLITKLRRND